MPRIEFSVDLDRGLFGITAYTTMNPFDPPKVQPRSIQRRIGFGIALTLLILSGIAVVILLGSMAKESARRDRSPRGIRQLEKAIQTYELQSK
jgi:hypothetical protein